MVIQERDRVIKELEEKVAFLEAEVSTHACTHTFISTHIPRGSFLLCTHHVDQSLVYTEYRAA